MERPMISDTMWSKTPYLYTTYKRPFCTYSAQHTSDLPSSIQAEVPTDRCGRRSGQRDFNLIGKGLSGRLYWYSVLPFHEFIIKRMLKKLVSLNIIISINLHFSVSKTFQTLKNNFALKYLKNCQITSPFLFISTIRLSIRFFVNTIYLLKDVKKRPHFPEKTTQ